MSTVVTWPTFVSKLKNRKEVAERTIAFRFEKPSGWTFKAGQFIDMTCSTLRRRIRKEISEGFRLRVALTKKH